MKQAIIRLAVLAFLLINQALIVFGNNPLPFSEEEVYTFMSTLATAAMTLWTYWKNNNITKNAQSAQDYLNKLNGKDVE